MPVKQIAAHLGVSPASVSYWVRDIEITEAQRTRNQTRPGRIWSAEIVQKRVQSWSEKNRQRRTSYQEEGRIRARARDPLHMAGCMLYWAEGSKHRNTVTLSNSDRQMVRFFRQFLTRCFEVNRDDFVLRLNVYTNNGLTIEDIEQHWLTTLDLPETCLRGHSLNHYPTSSSGKKRNRLPYGVCQLKVRRSTWLVQHIYGAIQEYAGFEEPAWLD
jgi:hypothetical protein